MREKFTFFKQPFPYFTKKWLVVFVTTFWVFFIFFFLRPFGLNFISYRNFVFVYFTTAAAFSSTLVTYIFPLLFKGFFNPQSWTKGKFFLFCLFITLTMVVLSVIFFVLLKILDVNIAPYVNKNLTIIIPFTIVCSIFPSVTIYLYEAKKSLNLSSQGQLQTFVYSADELIKFSGDTKNELRIHPDDFLYAEVIKNYVTIYFLENDELKEFSLRATLSQIMEDVAAYSNIIRCHRAFLVNLSHISEITGNSRGYIISLEKTKASIPVSRSYTKTIKDVGDIFFTT